MNIKGNSRTSAPWSNVTDKVRTFANPSYLTINNLICTTFHLPKKECYAIAIFYTIDFSRVVGLKCIHGMSTFCPLLLRTVYQIKIRLRNFIGSVCKWKSEISIQIFQITEAKWHLHFIALNSYSITDRLASQV